MALSRLQFHKVLIPRILINRKDWVRYLVLVNWHAEKLESVLTRAPDDDFNAFVEKQLHAYLEGTAPPEPIQTAIMNVADDVAAGRDVTLRAGDYIALQNHYRQGQSAKVRPRK